MLLSLAPAALAAEWTQTAKLLAGDPNALDDFGEAAAIDGERLVVGAPHDGEVAGFAGAAYVFERDADGRWRQVQKLVAPDAGANWVFGVRVAIDGDVVAAGATGADPIGFDETGAAYVFQRDESGVWRPAKKLKKPDGPGRVWGSSIAVSGARIAVGGTIDDQTGGAVYVFERDAGGPGNWGPVAKLKASDGGGRFGGAVALDRDRIVVGAQDDDDRRGAAYLFERDADGEWREVAKLTASDGDGLDRFGSAVDLDRETLVVGAHTDEDPGFNSGSAYVFQRDEDGVWAEVRKLLASDGDSGGFFGESVGLDGDVAVAGARNRDLAAGAAYVLERSLGGPDMWGQAAKLTASDADDFDNLGVSVAVSGRWIVAGSIGDDDGAFDAGAVYLFVRVEPRLSVTGLCPGSVTLRLTGATPNRSVGLLWGTAAGSTPVPSGPCAGTELGLADPALAGVRLADRDGALSFTRPLGAGQCDRLLQVLDATTCQLSEVVALPE